MRKLILLSLAFVPFLLVSCGEDAKEDNSSVIMVTTTVSKPESSDIKWSSGVAFTLYSDSQADESAGGRTLFCSDATNGTFKGEIANDKSRTSVSAIYPRQASGARNNIAVSVPSTQEYGRTGKLEILVAHESVNGNNIPSIGFNPLCCKAVVTVSNLIGKSEKLTGIQMNAKESIFAVSGAISSLDAPQFIALKSEKSLFCDFGTELDGNAETAFTFFPAAYAGKEVEISVSCADESVYTLKTAFPNDFNEAGSVCSFVVDLNNISPTKPGDDQPKKWLQVMTIEDLTDGDYIIAAAEPKANGKYSLVSGEEESFTYTEAHDDSNSTNKTGTGLKSISEADLDKWIESDDNTWTFKLEGKFNMKAGETYNVDGWSIKNKASSKYLNMNNGQNILMTDTFVENTETGASLLKQRWTITVSDKVDDNGTVVKSGVAVIRSIQNSGRYLRYYATDDMFMFSGAVSTKMVDLYLYKLNPDR